MLTLPHALEDQLVIDQPISTQLLQYFGEHLHTVTVFDLSNLMLKVSGRFPDGIEGPSSYLQLPIRLETATPSQADWDSYFAAKA